MSCSSSLQDAARRLFDAECTRRASERTDGSNIDFSPAFWLVSDLLGRVDESESDSTEVLASIVRRRVMDHSFVDGGGDAIVDADHQLPPDQQVDLVVTVLNQVLKHAA